MNNYFHSTGIHLLVQGYWARGAGALSSSQATVYQLYMQKKEVGDVTALRNPEIVDEVKKNCKTEYALPQFFCFSCSSNFSFILSPPL